MFKVLVTGSQGFVGKNLVVHLREREDVDVLEFHRESDPAVLEPLLMEADFVFHLAGINRPQKEEEFFEGNVALTKRIAGILERHKKGIGLIYSSSIQASNSTSYGRSKKEAEDEILKLENAWAFRLPNVFGKWSRPNYNSVVATFCHNISKGLPVQVNDPDAEVTLAYIDDVVVGFLSLMDLFRNGSVPPRKFFEISPVYQISVGGLAETIQHLSKMNESLVVENTGHGLIRALHATYLSFLNPEKFSYMVPKYEDQRGVFVEMMKTKDVGQMSFFTAHPGVTRGNHYHHTKTEKFLVVKGRARYRFRHILTDQKYEVVVDSKDGRPTIVETIPGWTHDITNIGQDELIVMLWASEVFDRERPDTKMSEV